jgi:ABC-2 type transport system permease protein
MDRKNSKAQALLTLAIALVAVVLINVLANSRFGDVSLYGQLDLTEENRFTLTPATERLLQSLDEVVFVRVLLAGDLPADFKRLQSATREVLEDFRAESTYVEFEFDNPNAGTVEQINERRKNLTEQGLSPVTLSTQNTKTLIYPYATFYFGGRELTVNILENEVPGVPNEVVLNNSVALLEYKFANAIQKLRNPVKPLIALSTGQGELPEIKTADLERSLRPFYDVGRLYLDSVVTIPQEIKALIVAKPTRPFSDKNLFKLDQYIMKGGKVLWLIDHVAMDIDSLRGRKEYYPRTYDLGLDDLFFRYGFRLNNDLVMDLRSTKLSIVPGGTVGQAAQLISERFPYFPLAQPASDHPIVKSLDLVNLFFPSSIDLSVQPRGDVTKTPLLVSSNMARYQKLPVGLDLEFLKYQLEADRFDRDSLLMGLLLEGTFHSFYENRMSEENLQVLRDVGAEFQPISEPTRMIVVADGDIAANPVVRGKVLPLGYNPEEGYQFSNKDFLFNALEYLLDDAGVITARGKEVRLRLLNRDRAVAEANFWRLVNIGLPLVILAVFGWWYNFRRRRRYAQSISSSENEE